MAKSDEKGSGENQANEQQVFEVTLMRDHEHNGEVWPASSKIKVNKSDRDWLLAQHVIAE